MDMRFLPPLIGKCPKAKNCFRGLEECYNCYEFGQILREETEKLPMNFLKKRMKNKIIIKCH